MIEGDLIILSTKQKKDLMGHRDRTSLTLKQHLLQNQEKTKMSELKSYHEKYYLLYV